MTRRRRTWAERLVLNELLAHGPAGSYGYELSQATGLRSGSLYPVLTRLADEGLTTSYIEDVDASTVGRPRRRYHRLTSNGILAAHQAAREAAQLGARSISFGGAT